ncbi:MAG: HDOD domain-containing protein [Gallionella sp.]|nr:HDOD domain-containing protein [Gallionella sp.]
MPARTIGRFEIIRELGKGGQGAVYLARDSKLDRQIAIKTLHKLERKAEQLTREAHIVSKLQHPNIIPLHDYGEDRGVPYLVYAYIEGKTLAHVLKQEKIQPFARAAEIAAGVLEALVCAHEQGISHLDIKPANIMIAKSGIPMVMDFGLAAVAGSHEQTIASSLSGTPRYVAPEVIAGQPGGPLSDVYAVGTVLYEMVTGKFAVGGENMFEVLNRAAHEQVAAPSTHNEQIDKRLEAIILKAVAKKPDDRYPDSRAMTVELREYLDESHNATVEFLLQRMRNKRDFPAVSGVISEINTIVSSKSRNASQLASAILKDLALTNKILRVVNTAAFAKYGGSINTISKAVAILGFDIVRNIATSLIMMEFLQNQPQAKQLKEEIIKGLLAGSVAAQLSGAHDTGDTEEIMVCSMFHSLGKMLALYYFHEESQEIGRLVRQGENEEIAAARVLGCSYSELGMSVAHTWKFPLRLLTGMRQLPAGKIPAPEGEMDKLTATINLAHDLCDLVSSSHTQNKQARLAELVERYENAGNISRDRISSAFDAGLTEIGERAAIFGIGIAESPLLSRAHQWSGQSKSLDPEKKENGQAMPQLDEAVSKQPGENTSDAEAILSAGVQDVMNSMISDFDLNDILQMILETMYRGMGFRQTLVMIRNNPLDMMAARFGFGADINDIIPRFRFPLKSVLDVFHLSIEKGLDISIEDTRATNIVDKIPSWYKNTVNAPCFVLLPLILNGKAIGLLYADMLEANSLKLSQQQLSLLRTLRNQAVLAIKQKI